MSLSKRFKKVFRSASLLHILLLLAPSLVFSANAENIMTSSVTGLPSSPRPAPQSLSPIPTSQSRVMRKNYFSSIDVGLSSLSYGQTGFASFHEFAVTGKASIAFEPQGSPFNFSGSFFFTGVAFASSSPNQDSFSFFGFNARVGYFIPTVKTPWQLNLASGFHFTSAKAKGGPGSDARLGYSISGIELCPTLTRAFKRGDSAGSYFKIAPLSNGFAASLANVEYGTGLNYKFVPNRQGRAYGISLEFSTINLVINTLTVHSTSFTFGASYYF